MTENSISCDSRNDAVPATKTYKATMPLNFRTILSNCYQFIVENTIGDAWKIFSLRNQFVTTELYQRSLENGIAIARLGPSWLPCLPTFVVVSGPVSNVLQVTNYGDTEAHPRDPLARSFLELAISHVTNLAQGLSNERLFLKRHMSEPHSIDANFHTTIAITEKCLTQWDEKISLQNNVGHYASAVIGKCVFGLPELTFKDVETLRKFEEQVVKGNFDTPEFIAAKAEFHRMSTRLIDEGAEEIRNAHKAIYDLLDNHKLTAKDIEELKTQIRTVGGASGLFPAGNLGMLLSSSIGYIAQDDEVKRRLREELSGIDWQTDWKKLKALPYLNCLYLECCRMASPAALSLRMTSMESELTIKARNGEVKKYHLPKHSYLFAPLRCINNEKSVWENPRHFNPDRFAGKDSYQRGIIADYFVPFAAGTRMCPASANFIPLVFKIMIAMLFSRFEISVDKPLEEIPVESLNPRWQQEYYACLTPIKAWDFGKYDCIFTRKNQLAS